MLDGERIWVENSGLVWVPILAFLAVLTWLGMNNLPQQDCGATPVAIGQATCGSSAWASPVPAVGVFLLISDVGRFPRAAEDLRDPRRHRALDPGGSCAGARARTTKDKLVDQFQIFRNKHNWIMTWLYTMTFGSFIGYAAAFPKLIDDVFGFIRVDTDGNPLEFTLAPGESTAVETASGVVVDVVNKTAEAVTYTSINNPNAVDAFKYAFLGAFVGAIIRPVGGWVSDKLGGARVTHWDTILMIGFTIGCGWFVAQANQSPTPESFFGVFLGLFMMLFASPRASATVRRSG